MADVFISYSTQDEKLALAIRQLLVNQRVTVFLAATSLQPGQKWSPAILAELRNAPWFILLASRAACASHYVQQEIGGALATNKNLVPIIWDMPATDLPGWTQEYQALDLARTPPAEAESYIEAIAHSIKANKAQGVLIFGLVMTALMVIATKSE